MSEWPTWAVEGARVVCIQSTPWSKGRSLPWGRWLAGLFIGFPMRGGVYTIVSLGIGTDSGTPVLEIKGWPGMWFRVENFKPVQEDKSDNEIEARLYHEKRKHHKAPARKVVSA